MKYLIYAALLSVATNSVLAESLAKSVSVQHRGKHTLVKTTLAEVKEAGSIYSESQSFEQRISPVELGEILKSFEADKITNPRGSKEDRVQNRWWRGSANKNIAWLTDGAEPRTDAPTVRSGIARVLIDGIEIQKLETTTTPVLWEINLISTAGISSKPEKVEFIVNDCDTPLADTNCAITLDEIWKSVSKELHIREKRICANLQKHVYALRQKQGRTNYLVIAERNPQKFHQITMYFSKGTLLAGKNLLDTELKACIAGYDEKQRASF